MKMMSSMGRQRKKAPARTFRGNLDGPKPTAMHLAIGGKELAINWLAAHTPAAAAYISGMRVVKPLLKHADEARDRATEHEALSIELARLRVQYPKLEIPPAVIPPVPEFDFEGCAAEIRGNDLDETCSTRIAQANRDTDIVCLRLFLTNVYGAQLNAKTFTVYKPATIKQGDRSPMVRMVLGNAPFRDEQLACLICTGISRVLRIPELTRSEVPIVAVAADFDEASELTGSELRSEFNYRSDNWRKKPTLNEKWLRYFLVGCISAELGELLAMFTTETKTTADDPVQNANS